MTPIRATNSTTPTIASGILYYILPATINYFNMCAESTVL